MRFLELYLKAYGPFTDVTLDLSKGRQGLHVLHGPNEAGKSSTLRAVHALLFGIHGQTPDAFVHTYRDLRIGARLVDADGEKQIFWRRKGNKDTLLDAAEEPIDESRLARLLGGITEPVFRDAFGIDHARLVEGGQTLLAGGGEVGESLFAAGLGSAKLRDLLRDLDEDCEALFKGGSASKPTINRLVAEYKTLAKATKDASLAGSEWTTYRTTLEKAEAERDRLDALLRTEKAKASQLERLARALPRLAKRAAQQDALDALEAAGAVPTLRLEFAEERRKAERALEQATSDVRRAAGEIETLETQVETLEVSEDLLAQREEVEALHLDLQGHVKAARDRGRLDGKRQQHETNASNRLLDLRPGDESAQKTEPALSVAQRKRIEELIDRHGALESTVRTATQTETRKEQAHGQKRQALAATTAPADPTLLRQALDRARRAGDLESNRAELTSDVASASREADLALERLGLWEGSLEDAEALAVPDLSTVERFETQWGDIESARRDLATRHEDAEQEIVRLTEALAALERGKVIPTEADLSETRAHREDGWRLVRRAWLDGETIDAATYDETRALPDAYEHAVERADHVSDDLRADADRVAAKAQHVQKREEIEGRLGALQADQATWTEKAEAVRLAWHAVWEPLGLTPLEPREMRAWGERYAKLLDRIGALRKAKAQCRKVEAAIEAHRSHVSTALLALGEAADTGGFASLVALLDHSEAYADGLERKAKELSDLEGRVEDLESEVRTAKGEREAAQAELATWQARWTEALSPLETEGEATPEQARAELQVLADLKDDRKQEASYADRIRAIDRDTAAFTARIEDVVAAVAAHLTAEEPHAALRTLHRRVQEAVKASTEREQLQKQITKWRKEHDAEEEEASKARRLLGELCDEAGAKEPSALPALERSAGEAASLRTAVQAIEDELVREGKGASLADLVAQAAEVDGDQLAADLDVLAGTIQDLEDQRQTVGEQLGAARNALDSIQGTAEAAEGAAEAEGVASGIRTQSEHYVRLCLARAILRREIERYRSDNQAPLLKRGSEIFARITCGSFASLESNYEESDQPVLLGLRPSGEHVDVEGMSDGTREQLYLALRLASLEQHLEAGTAVPLVVDDLLLRSDEARSAAIFEALADLSSRTQVLFFTHQRRYIDLARSLDRPDEVFVTELGPRTA